MITTKEISRMLNVSDETVRRWIRNGELKADLDGKSYVVSEDDLNNFINQKSQTTSNSLGKKANLQTAFSVGSALTTGFAGLVPTLAAGIIPTVMAAIAAKERLEKKGSASSEALNEVSNNEVTVNDLNDVIASLKRHKKKLELEYEMKLLEIEDQIANYEKLKSEIEKEN